MREIKFRAWDMKLRKIFIPEWIDGEYGEVGYTEYGDEGSPFIYPNRVILMQYTGLEDKNGKEVYEGDIVNWSSFDISTGDEYEEIGVIEWDEETACFVVTNKWMIPANIQNTTIIGNIYENPEMMKC